jgi:hypothetical protein
MKLRSALAAAILATTSLAARAVGDLADVSVLDRSTGQYLPVHWHEGRAYVVGRPGNEYQIQVRNRRGEDVLAVASVDGVNVLSGETANTGQAGYIVSAWNRVDIKGWRKSLSDVASFYFTTLPDSYAARTDRPNNVGVIGVALFRRATRWQPEPEAAVPFGSAQPRQERDNYGGRSDSSGGLAKRTAPAEMESRAPAPAAPLGTGHGRREDSPVRYTEFDRATREPAETITIYYDSYRNLLARGVLRNYAQPRDPQPFPAFAPDPWR